MIRITSETKNLEELIQVDMWATRCCYMDMFQIKTEEDKNNLIKEIQEEWEENVDYIELGTFEEINQLGR